jgi:DNA-3-methyladenine glycosylase
VTAALPVRRLRRSELPIETVQLARFLIGKILVHDDGEGRSSGRIIETEAYLPDDPASHSFRGPSQRNASMFLERGRAYVYLIYGRSLCINVVSETRGVGAAVLIRALEPLDGLSLMRARRGDTARALARGPGRVTAALGVRMTHDGVDLCRGGALWLGVAPGAGGEVGASVRIGISRAAERVLRFYERSNPYVSGPRRLSP